MKSPRVLAVGCILLALITRLTAGAQQSGTVRRIGWLGFGSSTSLLPLAEPFRQRLRELGYVEGRNLAFEYRWADGRPERLPSLAAELVHLRVDLLVCGTQPAPLACRKATTTIPILTLVALDPVGTGLAVSLARPGDNVTGLTWEVSPELSQKQPELLKEILPRLVHAAVLWDPTCRGLPAMLREAQVAAQKLGATLHPVAVSGPDDFEAAFAAIKKSRTGALIVLAHPLFYRHQRQIIDFAATNHLLAIYFTREFVEGGGLMAYGPDQPALYRRAAEYTDRIMKGAKPGDLPMEQPTKFELVINRKTAKSLGLTIPPSLLVLAEQIIE